MFDGRIYRAAFVPLPLVLVIAGFSLASQPGPEGSTLAPDAFNGARAFSGLKALSRRFPDRRPGSHGDDALAGFLVRTLSGFSGQLKQDPSSQRRSTSGAPGAGFHITTRQVHGQTIDGARTLTTVIAERSGSTGMSPIVIVAHRDASGHGSAAELSGTATLLELAHVFSQSETRRTIVLVSTSGGSGGDAGVADFALNDQQSPDAVIVLGDLAGTVARKPFVLSFSNAIGGAPESLQRTLDMAISQEVGTNPGAPSDSAQLAHLVFPLATGEEAPLNAAGMPAVLVQVSGERGPSASQPVSATRLTNFGRAVLGATYALDEGPDIAHSFTAHLLLGRKLLPGWALRLLVLTLILPPLLAVTDEFARLRRRREAMLRWVLWTLSAALPFFACALFAILLGALGIVAAPAGQLSASSLSADGSALGAVLSSTLVLVLALLAWPALVRRMALPLRPAADGAALTVILVLLVVALLAWIVNPFACLLLVPALHLWLLAVGPGRDAAPRARVLSRSAILLGVLPLVLLLLLYAHELGLGVSGLLKSSVLALAGGQVGMLGALVWSVALGCLLAVVLLVPPRPSRNESPPEWVETSTRGPGSYAGPGSLGGTESALRR